MDYLSGPTLLLGLTLLFAIIIERLLEIGKCFYDMADGRFNLHTFWNKRARHLADKLERRLQATEYVKPELMAKMLKTAEQILLSTKNREQVTRPVVSGDLVRVFYIKIIAKIIGSGLGIGIAIWIGIDFFKLWPYIQNPAIQFDVYTPTWWGEILTGIAVGLGAGPLHKLITAIELSQKIQRKFKEEA